MTEYEAASLAVQHASLAVEEAALTAAYWQTGISATTSALTLAVSSGLVLYGFRLMRRGTEQRRAEMDAAATAAEQRHAGSMTALTELIRRTGRVRPDGKTRSRRELPFVAGPGEHTRKCFHRHNERRVSPS